MSAELFDSITRGLGQAFAWIAVGIVLLAVKAMVSIFKKSAPEGENPRVDKKRTTLQIQISGMSINLCIYSGASRCN